MYICMCAYVVMYSVEISFLSKCILLMDQIIVLEHDMHNLPERHTNEGTKCAKFGRSFVDSND